MRPDLAKQLQALKEINDARDSGNVRAVSSINESSGESNKSSRGVLSEERSNSQDARGNSEGFEGYDTNQYNIYGDSESSNLTTGYDGGRSSNNGSSITNGNNQTTRYSGVVRVDPPIEDEPKRGPGRPPIVDTLKDVKSKIFSKKTTLTAREAQEYLEPLIKAIQDYGGYYDKYIMWRTNDPNMAPIWGNLTVLEAGAYARPMINRALKHPQAAEFVRGMINAQDYVNMAVMSIPRIMTTTQQMKKAPPLRKPKVRHANNNNKRQPITEWNLSDK